MTSRDFGKGLPDMNFIDVAPDYQSDVLPTSRGLNDRGELGMTVGLRWDVFPTNGSHAERNIAFGETREGDEAFDKISSRMRVVSATEGDLHMTRQPADLLEINGVLSMALVKSV